MEVPCTDPTPIAGMLVPSFSLKEGIADGMVLGNECSSQTK